MKKILYILLLFSLGASAQVENKIPQYTFNYDLGVGRPGFNNASAYLHVGTTQSTKGVLLSRVADTASVTGTKPNGLLIFSVQLNNYARWDSIAGIWSNLGGGTTGGTYTAGNGLALTGFAFRIDTTHNATKPLTYGEGRRWFDSLLAIPTAIIDNYPLGTGAEALYMDDPDFVYAKRYLGTGGITITNQGDTALVWTCESCGGGSGDTANLIFDTIPNGGSPTAVFQSGDTLRTREFGDSTGIQWTINGAGKIVAYLTAGGTTWDLPGNTLAGDGILGTLSNHAIDIYTNNVKRAEYAADGDYSYNATSSPLGYGFYVNDTLQTQSIRIVPGGTIVGIAGGDALVGIKSNSTSSSNYPLYILNSASTSLFRVASDGGLTGVFGSMSATTWQLASTTTTLRPSNGATTTGTYLALTHFNANTHTSGNVTVVKTTGNATMASGTGTQTSLEVAPIWALTSTAAGTLWGIKINPSYTGVANAESRWFEMTSTLANWPGMYMTQNIVSTTDATVTTLFTFPTIAIVDASNAMTYYIKAWVTGNRTGGAAGTAADVGVYEYFGVYQRINGVLYLVTETTTAITEDQAGWNLTTAISGTTILLQVTGATDNNIRWSLTKSEVHKSSGDD